MKLKIPVNNTVEVVVADLYVNIQCKLRTETPIETTSAKIVLSNLEVKINQIFSEAVYKAKKELEDSLEIEND